jgi:cytochrome c peroxidase
MLNLGRRVSHARRMAHAAMLLSLASAGISTMAAAAPPPPPAQAAPPAPAPAGSFPDASGRWSTFSPGAAPSPGNPFFQSLGRNGRSCATCHSPSDAWTATPPALQARFLATAGADPIFASLDGTNCPSLDVATVADHRVASSLLLSKGLIRVTLTPPANAQFAITEVSNPYGCSATSTVSVYRRILTTANLAFLSTVMWDGRETPTGTGIPADLAHQAGDAVTTHEAAAAVPAAAVLHAIEVFEAAQFAAQILDARAGALTAAGAQGGPAVLAEQTFSPGANAPFGGAANSPVPPNPVFTIYRAWESGQGADPVSLARASIGRGEHLFNSRPMTLTGVAGLNDQTGANGLPRTVVIGTCGTCHNAPNAGSHTTPLLLDTGIADAGRRSPDLPLLTLINRTTGATLQTSDPGLALTSGKWADVAKFKVPTLRGLAARAPYFHDGSAASLDGVVDFYEQRFALKLSQQEHTDLVAFLQAL